MRLHIFLHGRVQGVFFRAFVRKNASALGLKGWVRNVEDKVEVVAEGSQEALDELVKLTKKGPFLAKVTKQEVHKEKATGEFESFEIVY